MAANSSISLTNLDFDLLKQSLIAFLQSQPEFVGYNFSGPALNILMDLLAYNSHLLSYYLNAAANEGFLDTAILRSSVVSGAKSLGYTPRSVVSAEATVNVTLTAASSNSAPSTATLPRFTQFTSSQANGVNYTFITLESVTSSVTGGNTYFFNNLTLNEGTPVVKAFVQANSVNPTQIFNLQDVGIDTNTLQVIVQKSSTDTQQTVFELAIDATQVLSNTSNVYYIQESSSSSYQIYFGDGVIGASLQDGNIVVVSYLITDADAANYLNTFNLVNNPLDGGTSNVTTVIASAGGQQIESVASVQFTAPKAYAAQNRAVTVNDYITLINKKYPYFDAVNVWGGETINPPVYGVVFVSLKPKQGYVITQTQQQLITQEIIQPIKIVGLAKPQLVNPDYNFIVLDLEVEYNSKQTVNDANTVEGLIKSSVYNYANNNLNTFNSSLLVSRLLTGVDKSDRSILGSAATVWVEKRLVPTLNANTTYTMNVGISLHRGSVNDLLYSTPSFQINDSVGVNRTAYIEEVPESFTSVESIGVTFPGSGYLEAPTLIITGDGTGANAYSIIVNGQVTSVVVDVGGNNYTTAIVSAADGFGGSGVEFQANLTAQFGSLRTYYYDSNQNKVILNANAGSIDYINGIIILNSFAPTGINDPTGTLSIVVQPDTQWLTSNNERILTIDQTDPNAVVIDLIDINSL